MTIEFTVPNTIFTRIKPFSCESHYQSHQVSVDIEQRIVRVWDELAGYYTSCHSLSKYAQQRVIAMAEIIKHVRTKG